MRPSAKLLRNRRFRVDYLARARQQLVVIDYLLRKVSLAELGTHAEVALIAKPITTSEQAVLPALLKHLPEDALLLWDRGFFSYELWKLVVSRQIRILARVTKNLILKPIKLLGDGSYLTKIHPSSYDRQKDRNGINPRVIKQKMSKWKKKRPEHFRPPRLQKTFAESVVMLN